MTAYNDCVSYDSGIIIVAGLKKCYTSGNVAISFIQRPGRRHKIRETVTTTDPAASVKSTLPGLRGCPVKSKGGNVVLKGQDTTPVCARKVAKLLSFEKWCVSGKTNLVNELSADKNVKLSRYSGSKMGVDFPTMVQGLLWDAGLADHKYQGHSVLTEGQRQRVTLSGLILNVPSFILNDKSTGPLEQKTEGEIMGYLPYLLTNYPGIMVIYTIASGYGTKTDITDYEPNMAFNCEFTERQVTHKNIGYSAEGVAYLKTIPPYLSFRDSLSNMMGFMGSFSPENTAVHEFHLNVADYEQKGMNSVSDMFDSWKLKSPAIAA